MSTYAIALLGDLEESMQAPYGVSLMGTDQSAPGGIFTSTDFDKTVPLLKKFILLYAKGDIQKLLLDNQMKFMVGYRDYAIKVQHPYAQADLSIWVTQLRNYGLPQEVIMPLLSYYRRMHEAGQIPESVWDPAKWLHDNPEAKPDSRSWYQQLIDSIGQKVGKAAMWTGVAVAAYFILPKLLTSGIVALRRKK